MIFHIKLYDSRPGLFYCIERKCSHALSHGSTCFTRIVCVIHNTNQFLSAGREPGLFITKDCPTDFGKFADKFNARVDAKDVERIASYIHLSILDESGAAALTAGE